MAEAFGGTLSGFFRPGRTVPTARCPAALRWAAGNVPNVVRALVAPGLALQRLTTREPELPMIEVAIAALREVLASEGLEAPAEAPAAGETPVASPA